MTPPRRFTPRFSDTIRLQARLARSEEELARLQAENVALQTRVDKLQTERSALINRMNGEEFRLKAQGPCYRSCPAFKPAGWRPNE